MTNYKVISFYTFTNLDKLTFKAELIKKECKKKKITGLVILAEEGINGTLSGNAEGINSIWDLIKNMLNKCEMNVKETFSKIPAFTRIKVKIKKEIVTFGVKNIFSHKQIGQYIEPNEWNDLISKDDVIIIDTRNDYENRIGTFKGALNPNTKSFKEFPKWWEKNKKNFEGKSIAMFCTGGIRCEKSTKYILKDGVKNVYHLKGGILNYLKSKDKKNSFWKGECFVFDQRVSLDQDLNEGNSILCHACRIPLHPRELLNPNYEKGVSCPQCHDNTSEIRKNNFRERQKQIRLALERSKKHLKHFCQ